jgi:C-terminal processing protease CtpA/Prc
MNILIPLMFVATMYYGSIEQGGHTHGRIGILYNPVKHDIVEVYIGSPADKAGLMRHDVVLHVNDKDITGPAGTFVNLTIRRETVKFTVVIQRVPDKEIDVRHPKPHEH